MVYTDPSDVQSRYIGANTLPDDTVLATLIGDAEDTVKAAIPDLDARISDGRIPEDRLVKIVCRMVIRHVDNPQGLTYSQYTTGPFTAGQSYGGDAPATMTLSKAERRELLGVRHGRAFTIDTMPPKPLECW